MQTTYLQKLRQTGIALLVTAGGTLFLLKPALTTEVPWALKPTPVWPVTQGLSRASSAKSASSPNALALEQQHLRTYIAERFQVDANRASEVVHHAFQASVETGIHPHVLLAVAAVESGFDPQAEYRGAKGLMQIQASAHRAEIQALGGVASLFNVRKNMLLGAQILRDCLERVDNNLHKALLLYNGSTRATNPYADKVLREKARLDEAALAYR